MRQHRAKRRRGACLLSASGWRAQMARLGGAITQRAHSCAHALCQPPVHYRLALLLAALLAVVLTVFQVVSLHASTSPIALQGLMEQLL